MKLQSPSALLAILLMIFAFCLVNAEEKTVVPYEHEMMSKMLKFAGSKKVDGVEYAMLYLKKEDVPLHREKAIFRIVTPDEAT